MMNLQFGNVLKKAVVPFIITIGLLPASDSANDALQQPTNVDCVCPGEVLTFICNIIGGGTTLWTGTAFSCPSNEILLRHSQFDEPDGTSGSCNNGAIKGRSIGVINMCYSSELNVTVSTGLNGRTIQCNFDAVIGGLRTIGVSSLNVVTAMDPPSSIRLMDIQNGVAMIEWTPVDSCSPIDYVISSNCSTCSLTTTDQTTTSCSISEPTTDVLVCRFSVQSVVCDNLMGSASTSVVTLQTQASSVNLVPYYLADNKSLSRFTIRGINLTIASLDSADIFMKNYNVSYTDPTTGHVLHSSIVSTCGEDTCDTDVTPPLSLVCPSTSTINITVMADNGFGQRQLTDPITIGCSNQFVDVQYNSTASNIICNFLNRVDTSIKSCQVTYGECGTGQPRSVQGSSTLEAPNTVALTVMFRDGSICYNVTVSNGIFTLVVEGSIQSTSVVKSIDIAAIIGGVVPVFLLVIAVFLTVVIIIIFVVPRRNTKGDEESHELKEVSNVKKLKLRPVKRQFRKHTIQSSCTLKETVEYQLRAEFKRGHAYYEFSHKIENISKDKEIIFMDKETGKYFTPTADASVLQQCGLLGDGVLRQLFENYKVFIQSTGSGARHLPTGSILLYEHAQEKEWKPEDSPLMPITSKHFTVSTVKSDCTLEAFRREKNLESPNILNVFLELCDVDISKIERIRDVILMDKEKNFLFTGPAARSDPHAYERSWRVFILSNFNGNIPLKAGSVIVHQNPEYMTGQFFVLRVDKDNIKMSDFVEETLHVKFENGRAFYELTEVEDLLFYKEVVQMPKSLTKKYKTLEQKHQENEGKQYSTETLDTNMKLFYWIPGAPNIGLKGNFEHYKAFVQSTSQGSRCLKGKKLLLYKV